MNITSTDGANNNSHYFADDDNPSKKTSNGDSYPAGAVEEIYHYDSISEHSGIADDVRYPGSQDKDENNQSGFYHFCSRIL